MLSFATTTIYTHKRESSGSAKKDVDLSHGSDNFEGYSRLSAIIKYYLQNFNFSKATYYALMEILLERVSPHRGIFRIYDAEGQRLGLVGITRLHGERVAFLGDFYVAGTCACLCQWICLFRLDGSPRVRHKCQ